MTSNKMGGSKFQIEKRYERSHMLSDISRGRPVEEVHKW